MPNAILSRWLKQHAAGERVLTKSLSKFFIAQGQRVVKSLKADGFTVATLNASFDVPSERRAMFAAISDQLIGFIATGAEDIFAQVRKPKSTKAYDFASYELPAWMEAEISKAFGELEKQSYWEEIQRTTLLSVTDALKEAVKAGLSEKGTTDALQELFASFSDFRAAAIARTETTAAYNYGHQTSYEQLAARGDIAGKEWLAVVDDDTRTTHAEADGEQVGANETFDIGGSPARFPGDFSLPAKQRISCRCTTSGVFS